VAAGLYWIVPDRVGGMARPRPRELAWLRKQGVTALVSLTEHTLGKVEGFETLHVAVPDMTSPTLDQLHELIGFMRRVVDDGGKVVTHCHAGLGRTGTVLAAYLVDDGLTAGEAIQRVRELRPGSIETPGQEAMVRKYAELVGGEPT
jgi:atypical dual specificity phosphatase